MGLAGHEVTDRIGHALGAALVGEVRRRLTVDLLLTEFF